MFTNLKCSQLPEMQIAMVAFAICEHLCQLPFVNNETEYEGPH